MQGRVPETHSWSVALPCVKAQHFWAAAQSVAAWLHMRAVPTVGQLKASVVLQVARHDDESAFVGHAGNGPAARSRLAQQNGAPASASQSSGLSHANAGPASGQPPLLHDRRRPPSSTTPQHVGAAAPHVEPPHET